jgi:hypothetical protein
MISGLSIPEVEIQQIWAEEDLLNLRTVYGQAVKIEFAGCHNSGSAPGLKEASLQIGEHSLSDAVKIYVDSSGWYVHHHEINLDYNSVVLHVVLYNSGKRLIELEDKFKIKELELTAFFNKTPSTSEAQLSADLKSFGELPGRY